MFSAFADFELIKNTENMQHSSGNVKEEAVDKLSKGRRIILPREKIDQT